MSITEDWVRKASDHARQWTAAPRQTPDVRLELMSAHYLGDSAVDRINATSDHPMNAQDASSKRRVIEWGIRAADLYWCSADMVHLIETAAVTMPEQSIDQTDPPSVAGLVILQAPVEYEAANSATPVHVNALLWTPSRNPDTGEIDVNVIQLSNMGGRTGWVAPYDEVWTYNSTNPHSNHGEVRSFFAAFWTLARQQRPTATATDRPTARRVRRAGLPPSAGDVRLLDLRKPSSNHAEGEGSIEYSHRWIVNGHWRNQWLPSRKMHRAQWISPHIKGPEDKTLVIRDDVRVVA